MIRQRRCHSYAIFGLLCFADQTTSVIRSFPAFVSIPRAYERRRPTIVFSSGQDDSFGSPGSRENIEAVVRNLGGPLDGLPSDNDIEDLSDDNDEEGYPFGDDAFPETEVDSLSSSSEFDEVSFKDVAFGNVDTMPLTENTSGQESDLFDYDDTGSDGVFLDADMYARASSYMNADGSLNLPLGDTSFEREFLESFMEPRDIAPSWDELEDIGEIPGGVSDAKPRGELNMESFMEALQKSNSTGLSLAELNARAEWLHKKVFENEGAFLQQSQLFRDGLADRKKAEEAARVRRSTQFRSKSEESLKKLEKAMNEFEVLLDQQERIDQHTPLFCGFCRTRLNPDDKGMRSTFVGGKIKWVCSKCASVGETTPESSSVEDEDFSEEDWDEDKEWPSLATNGDSGSSREVAGNYEWISRDMSSNLEAVEDDGPEYEWTSENMGDELAVMEGYDNEQSESPSTEGGTLPAHPWRSILDPEGVVHFWNVETGATGAETESLWSIRRIPGTSTRVLRHLENGETLFLAEEDIRPYDKLSGD